MTLTITKTERMRVGVLEPNVDTNNNVVDMWRDPKASELPLIARAALDGMSEDQQDALGYSVPPDSYDNWNDFFLDLEEQQRFLRELTDSLRDDVDLRAPIDVGWLRSRLTERLDLKAELDDLRDRLGGMTRTLLAYAATLGVDKDSRRDTATVLQTAEVLVTERDRLRAQVESTSVLRAERDVLRQERDAAIARAERAERALVDYEKRLVAETKVSETACDTLDAWRPVVEAAIAIPVPGQLQCAKTGLRLEGLQRLIEKLLVAVKALPPEQRPKT